MDLPKTELSFVFDKTGETTGQRYEGKFTVLCALNMAKKHQLELEKTRLLADFLNPTDGLAGISMILANLRVKLVDGPEWWKQSNGGLEIMDEDILVMLFEEVMKKESEWREAVKNKGKAEADPNAQTESK